MEQLLDYFKGRDDVIAVSHGDGFHPERGTRITPERLQEHLAGRTCYGFYLMQPDNTVLASCVDHDNKAHAPDPLWRSKAEAVHRRLTELGIPTLIEVSQSGEAAHNWIFFSEPVPAATVRAFWKRIESDLGIKFKEIYPRQDKLKDDDESLGNLIRYPLWNKSRFVDVEWQTIEPQQALTIRKLTATELQSLVPAKTEPKTLEGLSARVQKLVTEPGTMLVRRWSGDGEGLADGSRSAICCSIASGLVRKFVPTEEIAAALRHWCRQHNYDKGERDDWIKLTIDKAYLFVADHVQSTDEPHQQPIEFERITCQQLDSATYEQEYLIERTLVRGQPCILAGGKKTLKTSLIVYMAIALATGGRFLGRLQAKQCRVTVMSGESGLATIQETARRIAAVASVKLADIESLIWSTSLPKIGSALHLEALERFLKADAIEVLFLDPAYLAMPGGDAGNLFVQGELLSGLNDVCQQLGVGLVLAHHTRKGNGKDFDAPELESIAWAGFQEFCRQWLLIGRREKYEPRERASTACG
ncbi:MAG: AAA family ATPase [Planctomycetes bacterium]|nr:AAA family ATPase [Planctomycetota bacterium]